MAAVTWVGRQIRRPQLDTITIGSNVAGTTFTVTINQKTITYTALSTDTTTALVTAGLLALLQASTEGEFSEITWATPTTATSTITATGPDDGAPVTITVGGTGTISLAHTTTPLSPHDANDPLNYSTGALPVTGVDSLTLEDSAVDILYNAGALAAITLAAPGFTKNPTFTGRVGLPTTNANGYPEYRVTEFSIKTTAATIIQSGDAAQQMRLKFIDPASPVTVTVTGDGGNAQVGQEALEIEGLPASSVVDVTGGSVAIAPLTGQACTVLTLLAVSATVRVGSGATLSGTVNLKDCQAQIGASWTTSLTVDGTSAVEITGAAAGPSVVIDGGTVTWHSTGNPGSGCVVGSNGVLDLSTAPKTLTIGGTINVYEGYTIVDTAGRGGNYAVAPQHCALQDGVWQTPNGGTYTKS